MKRARRSERTSDLGNWTAATKPTFFSTQTLNKRSRFASPTCENRSTKSAVPMKGRRFFDCRKFTLEKFTLFCSVHSCRLSDMSCVLKSSTQSLLSTRSRCSNRRQSISPKRTDLSILNESTSSFRYPCLVTTYSLSLSLPWYIARMCFGHSQLP